MNLKIRKLQQDALAVFARHTKSFALSGGTALELYYLHHRFSRDLDFFSCGYNIEEVKNLITKFKKEAGIKLVMEYETKIPGRASMRVYITPEKKKADPFKVDFVEDVLFAKPTIKRFNGIPVYDIRHIYAQKIFAVIGTNLSKDDIGREIAGGRRAARDVFDIYMLSQKIVPLHKFIRNFSRAQLRSLIHWYRTFSRYDLKIEILDLDIYNKKFDVIKLLNHFDDEIKKIIEVEP